MKTITKFLGAACVVGLGLASTLASTTALAQEKIKIGVSIPAATHGWAGGLNYHAEQAEKRTLLLGHRVMRSLHMNRRMS